MNKHTFLTELEKRLLHLPYEERQDILRDMEEYFREGKIHGKSDEDIIKSLGSPRKIAETIIAEAKVKRISEASTFTQKVAALFSAMLAVLLLIPFNLIFVFLPLLLATLIIVIGWPIVFVIILCLPIIWFINALLAIQIGFHFFSLLALIFFGIGCLSIVMIIVFGFFYLTLFYFKGVTKLLKWNLTFIKRHMRDE